MTVLQRLSVLLALLATVAAAQSQTAPGDTLDLFLIAGQSNAAGAGGNRAEAPMPTPGTAYYAQVLPAAVKLKPLDGSTDSRIHGTVAPAFAVRYHAETGRRTVFLQTAFGGTTNVFEADQGKGHWSATEPGPGPRQGPNRLDLAFDDLAAVFAMLPADTPPIRIAGLIWIQGESDAMAVDAGMIEPDAYRESLRATMERFGEALAARAGRPVPLYVVQVAYLLEGGVPHDTEGFRQVRAIQAEGAEAGGYTLACDHPVTFPEAGLLYDYGHWNQEALNLVGAHVGEVAARDAPGPVAGEDGPPAPPAVAVLGNPGRGRARFSAPVSGVVVDALGREVARLDRATQTPPLAPGLYVLRSDRGAVRFSVVR